MTSAPIRAALNEAKHLALDILHNSDQQSSSYGSFERHYHYYPDYCWIPHPVYTGYSSATSSKKKEKDNTWIAVAAGIVVLVTSYFLGAELGKWSNLDDQKQSLAQRKISVMESRHPAATDTMKVLNFQNQMIDGMESDAILGVALKTALIASAAAAGIGACVGASLALGAGVIGALGFSAALSARWGFFNADACSRSDARHLLDLVSDAERKV